MVLQQEAPDSGVPIGEGDIGGAEAAQRVQPPSTLHGLSQSLVQIIHAAGLDMQEDVVEVVEHVVERAGRIADGTRNLAGGELANSPVLHDLSRLVEDQLAQLARRVL